MFNLKIVFLLVACLVLTVSATQTVTIEPQRLLVDGFSRPISQVVEPQRLLVDGFSRPILARRARSPDGGSVDVTVKQDQNGKEASVNYNHNLYTSNDGRGSIDAYAQGSRNFDHNRNDFNGGIRGSWRF